SFPNGGWMPGSVAPARDNRKGKSARSAKAPLRDWQDTVADRTPVQNGLRLPQFALPEHPLAGPSNPLLPRPSALLHRRASRPAILTLSLAPTVGLGIGRFAYALVLPDMRDSLHWSYSAAGFMNTIN